MRLYCRNNTLKIDLNAITNRLRVPNGRISLCWLSLSIDSFKVKFKETMLKGVLHRLLCVFDNLKINCFNHNNKNIRTRKTRRQKASFWGLLGLIPGNLIFQELKFFRLTF